MCKQIWSFCFLVNVIFFCSSVLSFELSKLNESIHTKRDSHQSTSDLSSTAPNDDYYLSNPLDRMLNDEDDESSRIRAAEENDAAMDYASLDVIGLNSENEHDNEAYEQNIRTNRCEVDKCRSANQTNNAYKLVDCVSVNYDYRCYYCPKNYVLIKHKQQCAGPCKGVDDCLQMEKDRNKHVECNYGFSPDEKDSNLCIKDDSITNSQPYAISYYTPAHWKKIKNKSQNRTSIHQIDLGDVCDVCRFEMKLDYKNDPSNATLTDFAIETACNPTYTASVYLNKSFTFESASLILDCIYKNKFILHRTQIKFSKDSD